MMHYVMNMYHSFSLSVIRRESQIRMCPGTWLLAKSQSAVTTPQKCTVLIRHNDDGRADNNPAEETLIMQRFYGGKRCVVTLGMLCIGLKPHMLEAALPLRNSKYALPTPFFSSCSEIQLISCNGYYIATCGKIVIQPTPQRYGKILFLVCCTLSTPLISC